MVLLHEPLAPAPFVCTARGAAAVHVAHIITHLAARVYLLSVCLIARIVTHPATLITASVLSFLKTLLTAQTETGREQVGYWRGK
jgi:hypothetical protein